MKIAVCGKGGCGKSTVTSLLAKALARRGKEILVIDSDESNYGLHRQLGMKLLRCFWFRTSVMGVIQDTDTIAYLFLHQIPHTLSKRAGIADGGSLTDTGGKGDGVRP